MSPLPTRPFHRLTAVAAASMLGLTAGAGLPDAQSIERYSMPAGSVALYDLAGRVTLEAATGNEVVVEVTRGGTDGARLRVQQGPVGDWQTLRVVFPANHIVYDEPGTWGMQTQVGNDGRFDDEKLIRIPAERHRVEISGRGPGLDAHADLYVRVPAGRTLALFLAAGAATVTNVDGNLRLSVGSASVTTRNTRGSLLV